MSSPFLFLFLLLPPVSGAAVCGNLQIPFPFSLNTTTNPHSIPLIPSPFLLYCLNSTLFLNLTVQSYRILQFLSDAVLVDFPGPPCRHYNDFNAFSPVSQNPFFAISNDNLLALYDCNDSSLCKPTCRNLVLPGCDSPPIHDSPACCYSLTDRTLWRNRGDFTLFLKMGCRGFSSWAVEKGWRSGKRGVKLEWGLPRNLTICDKNGFVVNATAVSDGVRCSCSDGFVGDGFANGFGCYKSCVKNGRHEYGSSCNTKLRREKEFIIFTGILAPLFIIASLVGLFCILRRPIKQTTLNSSHTQFHSNAFLQKACRTRLFTYHELQQATRGFEDNAKLVDSRNGAIFAGVLGDGSRVAIHRLQCENEGDVMNVLSQIEVLYVLAHKHVAHILGCCIDPGYAPLVVYEYPDNGTLEKHLHHRKGTDQTEPMLDWYRRLRIAAETASVLTFLQCEVSPPIFHNHLESCHIFLDANFSSKVSGFGLLSSPTEDKSHPLEASSFHNNDVYDFGVILLEMVTGLKNSDLPMVALQKIRIGKLEEVVDPLLYYHEKPPHSKEQIEIVADLATRCLLFGRDGKLRMSDVSKELTHIMKDNVVVVEGGSTRGSALEETFSNSSLLQMISMSPDSILAP
ncbi:probably inactive receptor-like protein kinase At2g46850 [Benincasa hispida]|uniref:probably inactive receptor-like protein kinase At2g46850 n=1 Tax=Benincasa hispida TaxID=102211 RepID=UPI0019012159|nr:probably inactive receptor-like protein kinase At2g46850 [Benincasa hispida]